MIKLQSKKKRILLQILLFIMVVPYALPLVQMFLALWAEEASTIMWQSGKRVLCRTISEIPSLFRSVLFSWSICSA